VLKGGEIIELLMLAMKYQIKRYFLKPFLLIGILPGFNFINSLRAAFLPTVLRQ
jgi:hypothetical protein